MAGSLIVLGWQWNLWLLQVTLGKCHELLDANADAHKLPSGYHSVKGLGKLAPNSAHNRILYVYVFHTFSIVVAWLHVTYITYDQLPLMLIFLFCCLWLLMCTQGPGAIIACLSDLGSCTDCQQGGLLQLGSRPNPFPNQVA